MSHASSTFLSAISLDQGKSKKMIKAESCRDVQRLLLLQRIQLWFKPSAPLIPGDLMLSSGLLRPHPHPHPIHGGGGQAGTTKKKTTPPSFVQQSRRIQALFKALTGFKSGKGESSTLLNIRPPSPSNKTKSYQGKTL